ncbi:MAG: hypothetical protein DMF56_01640 [Acidobacteria bacterium]|nr:MAG: hypothetical protein DMF56_01640 [Acidobacteriota bacterium]
MIRKDRVRQLEDRLAGRSLIYFGTRGTDARPLLELGALSEVFCQVAPLQAAGVSETCLEIMTRRRVDLNSYSIDQDSSEPVRALRAGMLKAFSRPAAIVPYRPTALVASAWFPRSDRVQYLGMFHEHQACFEHKPWVETQLSDAGVRILPWSYYSDDDLILIREAAERDALVLRANRSDGGAGLTLIRTPSDLQHNWPSHEDGFLAAARFLTPSIPLNINACVFAGGEVSIHAASVQLIGISACTNRTFGYCGNDFAQFQELGSTVINALDRMVRTVGAWLARKGYLGAFGIDALLHEDKVYLAELNPRFQGSSRISAELDAEVDRPDIFLNHIAAFMRLTPPPLTPLSELTRSLPPYAHIVCHNLLPTSASCTPTNLDTLPLHCSLVPAVNVAVEPEGILADCLLNRKITNDGTSLLPSVESQLRATLQQLYSTEYSGLTSSVP